MLKFVRNNSIVLYLFTIFSLVIVSEVNAHTSIAKKNTADGFAQRSELEGSSSIINNFSISHGCAAPGSQDVKPIRAQAIVFPNGAQAIAQDSNTGELVNLADHIIGNAIMSAKPVQNYNIFKNIRVKEGPVPLFNSHGEKTSDVRAFYYNKGKLKTYLIGLVPFSASFPTFAPESCATKVRINIAIANYCTHNRTADNRADIWIGNTTVLFDDADVVSTGFWPYIDVKRDLNNNPLPEGCDSGMALVVTPSNESIDELLPIKGYWPHNQGEKVKEDD